MNRSVKSKVCAILPRLVWNPWWAIFLLVLLFQSGQVSAAVPDVNPAGAYIEAEDYTAMGAPNPWAWEIQSGVSGANQSTSNPAGSYLYTTVGGTGTVENGSRIDFPVNFTAGGNYQMWLRARDASPSGNGDSTFWGIDGVVMGALTEASAGSWEWTTRLQNGVNTANNITAGSHVINLWPREAGQHTDAVFIIRTDQTLPTNIFEASTAGVPTGHTALDFSTVGPGVFYITFPDGQFVNGGPLTLLDTTAGGSPTSQQLEYQTDLSSLQYRALGGQADGFPGFSLDSKWIKTDIGGDTTVSPTVNDGPLTLLGAGANIWSTLDYFSYLYQSGISGDFTIDINVKSFVGPNTFSKAGIMVRQSLTSNSANVAALVTQGDGARMQYRATSGGTTVKATATNGIVAPEWLRLVRSGNNFTTSTSSDGLVWTSLGGSVAVSMTDPVYIGLVVTSNSTGNAATAVFENFHFMPAATSGMSTTWSAASGSIATTGWTDGVYGLALNSGATFHTGLFDYSSCVDASPSSISIAAGQTVQGSSVSLSGLYSSGGNVSSFTYQINGLSVNNPWNSLAYGSAGPEVVSLHVTGIDPDCGGSLVSATQSISVDNSCTDPTPSTLTILTGQTAGGSTVDLSTMVSSTGNVAGLSYKINGVAVATPTAWDSTGYGLATPESVSLEVTGSDPECGGSTLTAINTIEVDNTCTRHAPSIVFDHDVNYAGAGRTIAYQVTIRNEDSQNCGPTTFNVAFNPAETNSADFDAAVFNPVGSNSGIVLEGRKSVTIEMNVKATAAAAEWSAKTTTLEITSVEDPDAAHNAPKTTGSIETKVFLVSPITHNSVTTKSTKWGGSWGTSETVANAGIDSKYGNFDCLLCHEKGGPNVKWMRGDITLPGADWGTGGTAVLPITFLDARENGDWGNDDPNADGSGRSGSTRPCETCHTITDYHRFDTNADPVDPPEGPVGPQSIVVGETHFPDRDCTDCHRHSLGFTASCVGCHGNPPIDATLGGPSGLADIPAATGSVSPGTHYKHVEVLGYACEYCHADWRAVGEMPKTEPNSGLAQINHTFAVFGSAEPAATAGQYTGQDGLNYQPVADLISRGIQDANGTVQPGKGTMTCESTYCHGGTDNMGGSNPQWNGNVGCNSCHGTSSTNTPPGYSHTTHVGQMGMACTICHGTATGVGVNGHVSGSVHVDLTELRSGFPNSTAALYNGVGGTVNGAKWDSGKLAPSDAYGTCSNVACHYDTTTPVWNNNNQPATCTICHNDGVDSGLLDDSAPVTGAHGRHMSGSLMASTFIDKCQSCHGGGANNGDHGGHVNFATDFAANVTWSGANRNCANSCHEGDYQAGLWDSPSDLNCDACHKSPYLGPTVVDPAGAGAGMAAAGYGSHLKATTADSFSGTTDWKAQCEKCHPYHAGGVLIPQPSVSWDQLGDGTDMAAKLGLQFPVTGGIHMGGTATGAASSEAEICWFCHNSQGISEWGVNNNAMTGSMIYDYGSLDNPNWTSATWTSARGAVGDIFEYKTNPIESTHAANVSSVVGQTSRSGVDDVGGIRCSYCHDVHDRNKALLDVAAGTTEALTGAPYLRGAWKGNPYKEDGAPTGAWDYYDNPSYAIDYGPVPRGVSNNPANKMGGYWIDQNSGNPTSGWTTADSGGICVMCHGADVDTLDQYGDNDWVGTNGHANAVLGGTGANKYNIYNPNTRNEGSTARDPRMGYQGTTGVSGSRMYGLRNADGDEPGNDFTWGSGQISGGSGGGKYAVFPYAYDVSRGEVRYAYQRFDWGVDFSTTTAQTQYHKFSCSKCHNPHASRLPRLMITNCLDVVQNTWDDNFIADGDWTSGDSNGTNVNWSVNITKGKKEFAYSQSAQNCHRFIDLNADGDGIDVNEEPGWNKVTPW